MDASQRKVLDAVPVGLQIWEATGDDPRTLTLTYANAEARREAGFDIAACVGRTVLEIFPATEFGETSLHSVALAQEPAVLEFAYRGDERLAQSWWRFQVTPIGGRARPAAGWDVTQGKSVEC